MILSLQNVHKRIQKHFYSKSVCLLESLSFDLAESESLALLGSNGSGKTTAMKIILGLLPMTSGSVLFRGKPLTQRSKEFIGYMPETNKLPLELTAKEFLMFRSQLFRQDPRFIKTLIEDQGLHPHQNKKICDLSKGLQRKVAWVQAILHKPELLILDEPLSGLDPWAREKMHAEILAQKSKGVSILLSTHDFEQVKVSCDRLVILQGGRLVYSQGLGGASFSKGDILKFYST